MKKALKITGIVLLSFVLLLVIGVLLIRFAFRDEVVNYLVKTQAGLHIELLRNAGTYTNEPNADYHFTYMKDTVRTREIHDYFRLDTLVDPTATTWDNTLSLARFVARNIPHANQKIHPKKRNAIALWEYSRTVEPAFNCRLHAIMLHELLLASGITNRFVTCFPADSLDNDCHVVNIVWLPERQKWAMIDSDGCSFITDPKGTPLSLQEMRQRTIAGETLVVCSLGVGKTYDNLLSYWTKNLYWFNCWEQTGYDKEPNGKGRSIVLLPHGFDGFRIGESDIATSDAERFWAAPDTID